MKTQKLFLVNYTDCYGNGRKTPEVIVKNKTEFKKWLNIHNEKREAQGESPESANEFELIQLPVFNSKTL